MKEQETFRSLPEIVGLHPNFGIQSGKWMFNRYWNPQDGIMSHKIRVGFDDPHLLDNIGFSAKIGINNDPKIPHVYILFAYGSEKDENELLGLANNFPYAEIIKVGSTGNAKEGSEVQVVKE